MLTFLKIFAVLAVLSVIVMLAAIRLTRPYRDRFDEILKSESENHPEKLGD